MNSEPSTKTKYMLGTEDISETNPVLYNLHIIEGYDLAGAIREYSELYNLDDHYENPVVIRKVEQWRGVGPISGSGVRSRPDRTKPEQDESREEATTKEAIVKGDRSEVTVKERKPIDVIQYVSQFNLTSELELLMPYLLEMTNTDDGSFERRVILVDGIGSNHIDYRYWTEDGEYKTSTLTPQIFQEGACKLYRITEEDLK